MNIAILGAGNIASVFAKAIAGTKGANCYAVASREESKAAAFAKEYGFEKYYGSYTEMLQDETIYMLSIMDGLRKDWGMKYPME